jgi:hypothetical protein
MIGAVQTCEVLAVDAPRLIAWRTIPTALMVDSTDWRISLEPVGAGTQIVQTFQLTKFPRWWEWILARINPSHIDRSAALTEDLRRIGVIAAAAHLLPRLVLRPDNPEVKLLVTAKQTRRGRRTPCEPAIPALARLTAFLADQLAPLARFSGLHGQPLVVGLARELGPLGALPNGCRGCAGRTGGRRG